MPTFTSQPSTGFDTWLNVGADTTNYGTSDTMRVGESTISSPDTNGQSVGLLKFDLSSLSSKAVVTSAKIYLTVIVEYSGFDKTMYMYRCNRNWGNTTATWSRYDGINFWSTVGARGIGTDRESTSISSRIMYQTYLGEVEWVLTNSLVQEWINGTKTNYGVVLDYSTFPTGQDQYRFATSNHATASYRPKIIIEYTLPSGGSHASWWD